MKNYFPTTSLNGHPKSSIPDFSLAKNRRQKWLSRVPMKYKKIVEESKKYKNDFYANDSLNDNLESEI